MSNLVERLRNQKYNATPEEIYADSMEAADEIERLRIERRTLPEYDDAISAISKENLRLEAEIERLEAALHFYADNHKRPNEGPWGASSNDFGKVAIAALEEEK